MIFLKRLWAILKISRSTSGLHFSGLLAALFLCAFGREIMKLHCGLLASKFYVVLPQKNISSFLSLILYSLLVVVVTAMMISLTRYITQYMAVKTRFAITAYLQKRYFTSRVYLKMNTFGQKMENPDQRITSDVNGLTLQFFQVVDKIIFVPPSIFYYSYTCYNSMGYLGPLSIYGFFLISLCVNKFLMSPLAALIYRLEQREGDFRYHHVKVRNDCESIAFYYGDQYEEHNLLEKLQSVVKSQFSIVNFSFFLNVSVTTFDYVGSILSYCIIAIPLFAGHYDDVKSSELSGLISANSFYCMYLIYCFTQLIDLSQDISTIAGLTHRVAHFIESAQDILLLTEREAAPKICVSANSSSCPLETSSQMCSIREQGPLVEFQDISISVPLKRHLLVQNLTFQIEQHKNLLIMGPSGCGKSSILRVLADLWTPTLGLIRKPHNIGGPSGIFYIPQTSHLLESNLIENVMYPSFFRKDLASFKKKHSHPNFESPSGLDMFTYSRNGNQHLLEEEGAGEDSSSSHHRLLPTSGGHLSQEESFPSSFFEDRAKMAISLAGLDPLLMKLRSSPTESLEFLSPGEVQRIGFARLFFHQPQIGILDEATSSLSGDVEKVLYENCKMLGITLLSIGHRESLKAHHDQMITISSSGMWTLSNLSGN